LKAAYGFAVSISETGTLKGTLKLSFAFAQNAVEGARADGVRGGVAGALNTFNPLYALGVAGVDTKQAVEKGDYEAAAKGVTAGLLTIGAAVIGGKGSGAKGGAALEGSVLRAESPLQGSLLRQQLAAEEVTGTQMPSQITGYTRHGLEQAIIRDGVGVSAQAIVDAVRNPSSVFGNPNGTIGYVGSSATVVLNAAGKVVTTWANGEAGLRVPF
jgi:hypothetical protein